MYLRKFLINRLGVNDKTLRAQSVELKVKKQLNFSAFTKMKNVGGEERTVNLNRFEKLLEQYTLKL